MPGFLTGAEEDKLWPMSFFRTAALSDWDVASDKFTQNDRPTARYGGYSKFRM